MKVKMASYIIKNEVNFINIKNRKQRKEKLANKSHHKILLNTYWNWRSEEKWSLIYCLLSAIVISGSQQDWRSWYTIYCNQCFLVHSISMEEPHLIIFYFLTNKQTLCRRLLVKMKFVGNQYEYVFHRWHWM